jgi:hypothetical protein
VPRFQFSRGGKRDVHEILAPLIGCVKQMKRESKELTGKGRIKEIYSFVHRFIDSMKK